jgi:hypothetical protein
MTPTSINDTHTVTTPLAPMASDPIHITSNTTFPSLPPSLGNVPFPMLASGEFPRCGTSSQEQYQAVEEKDISQHAREYLYGNSFDPQTTNPYTITTPPQLSNSTLHFPSPASNTQTPPPPDFDLWLYLDAAYTVC